MDELEIMDYYEELMETMQQLNKEAPKIKKMYDGFQEEAIKARKTLQALADEAKEVIAEAETSGAKRIKDLSSEQRKKIQEGSKALETLLEKGTAMQHSLGLANDEVAKQSERLDGLIETLNSRMTELEEQLQENRKLKQRISTLEKIMYDLVPHMEINYEELAPGIDLFNKYNGRIGRPVVLDKPSYTKDYCFRVSGVDEEHGVLIGRYYQLGKLYGDKTTFNYSTKCKMFNGATLDDVIAGEI